MGLNARILWDLGQKVGTTALFKLVMERADGKVAFEFLEGLFDLGELKEVFSHFDRIGVGDVASQEVPAFAPPRDSQGEAV